MSNWFKLALITESDLITELKSILDAVATGILVENPMERADKVFIQARGNVDTIIMGALDLIATQQGVMEPVLTDEQQAIIQYLKSRALPVAPEEQPVVPEEGLDNEGVESIPGPEPGVLGPSPAL
tara:strand:- start:5083 stop:5460 length:378 start_codon:yes stop_codon:yes gene_type:complete